MKINEKDGGIAMIWIFLIIVIVIVLVSITTGAEENDQRMQSRKVELNAQQEYLRNNNVTISAEYVYETILAGKKIRFIVDDISENIYISLTCSSFIKVPYSDINGCEIVVDSQVTGGIKRAIVGGVIAGDAGAIVGAKTAKSFVMSYKVIIYKNTVASPVLEIILLEKKTDKENRDYINAVEFSGKVNATIKAILNKPQNPFQKTDKSKSKRKNLIVDLEHTDKITAIKNVQQKMGLGLADAKAYVEKEVISEGMSEERAQCLANEYWELGIATKIVDCDW